jgi:hypothetical protein
MPSEEDVASTEEYHLLTSCLARRGSKNKENNEDKEE